MIPSAAKPSLPFPSPHSLSSDSAMNLLRKNLASSVSLRGKPSPVSLYLSSLLRASSGLCSSARAVEFGERQSGVTVSGVAECSMVNGSLIAQRRFMSTSRGRSMRSKVEKRMQRETGKTLREMRHAKKLRKKLMTEDERLIYNLRRAKKKVALLLQKLKKFELPDLPPPRHDPELLTEEQLQAYKKIGFRNRNYVPVGVRGVFGGVVQNMHLHWKFHETVQVCCDNFPKEKIKEMATMLARLSGGIVVNIHDVKTIIMFRGRNYRQPKNLIPLNTLTKRKALFKARFEQALESQQLNIKKIEQQLRRKGVNPEDPVHMASVQRVASTFFRAIDEQQGTPYVFRQPEFGNEPSIAGQTEDLEVDLKPNDQEEDSDQEELDRYIKEIEDAADQEWEEEEAAEKEQENRIRYWSNEDYRNRQKGRFERGSGSDNSDAEGGEVWDVEEEDSGDDFSNREVRFRREERNNFGPSKTYRSREINASRKVAYDRSRNGSYRDDYREENYNKSTSGRGGRVGFDSGNKGNFGKGFNRAEGYRDVGRRRTTDNEEFLQDSVEDFGNNGFRPRKGYNGQHYKGSKGMDRRVEFESDDELDESDEGFGGHKSSRGSSRSRLRWDKSQSILESDNGEELNLAASKDYGLDYASINDSYGNKDTDNGTVGTLGHLKGESSKKNSDESWDSD